MDRNRAVEILKEYFDIETRRFPERPAIYQTDHILWNQIRENKLFWEIPYALDEDVDGWGWGPYLIDKENGKIYLASSQNYVLDFELMKQGKIKWKELRSHFLDVDFCQLPERNYISKTVTVNNEDLNDFLTKDFRLLLSEVESNRLDFNPIIKRISYNEFRSIILIGYPFNFTSTLTNARTDSLQFKSQLAISLNFFRGDHQTLMGPMREIRTWFDVNTDYKATGSSWIELVAYDKTLEFEDWLLKLNLEVTKNLELPNSETCKCIFV